MRQSRRSFLDVLSGGRPDSTLLTQASGLPRAATRTTRRKRHRRRKAPRDGRCLPVKRSGSGATNDIPLGPGKTVLDAIVPKFPEAGRYPFNSTPADGELVAAIATKFGTKPENVVLGAGSQEFLKTAVRAFTSPSRGLVTAAPSFENCLR